MQEPSPIQSLRRSFVFTPEEPGYLAVILLFLAFLALTPKASCSFQDDTPPAARAGR
jgi:hypothetical protein